MSLGLRALGLVARAASINPRDKGRRKVPVLVKPPPPKPKDEDKSAE